MIDDVVTRANYDVAIDLIRGWAVELAEEVKTMPSLPPKCHKLANKITEADEVARTLRRQMIVEVAG